MTFLPIKRRERRSRGGGGGAEEWENVRNGQMEKEKTIRGEEVTLGSRLVAK